MDKEKKVVQGRRNGRQSQNKETKVHKFSHIRAFQEDLKNQAQETHDLRGGRSIKDLVKNANRKARSSSRV